MSSRIIAIALALQLIAIAVLAMAERGYVAISVIAITAVITLALFVRVAVLPIRTLARGEDMLRGQDFNSRLRTTGHRDTDRLVGMFNDMMTSLDNERRRVRETNRYLDLLVDASPMGIINLDFDDNIALVNPAASKLLDADATELIGHPRSAILGSLGEAIAAMVPGQTSTLDLRRGGSDDHVIFLSCYTFIDRGFPRLTIFLEPMTGIIRRAEREAYGRIIRIMAHEINNSMGAVGSAFDLLLDTPELVADSDLLGLIRSCSDRTKSLTAFIDSYARVARFPAPELAAVEISTLLDNIFPTLRAIGRGAELELEGGDKGFLVMADAVQIEQVMVNVVKNAAESICRSGREDGRIVITVDSATRSLTVTDNGAGIAPDAATSIFTPFFTTKSGAAASGIGLTLTSEILRGHNVKFALATNPADGLTRFTLRFPPL